MGAAIVKPWKWLDSVRRRTKSNGIVVLQAWVFLVTGRSCRTDRWCECRQIEFDKAEAAKAFLFAVGWKVARFDILKQITTRETLKLKAEVPGIFFVAVEIPRRQCLDVQYRRRGPMTDPTGPRRLGEV